MTDPSPRHRRRSPALAATLSFLLPGLGQLWAGSRTRGALLLAPIVVLLGLVAGLAIAEGAGRSLGLLLQPGVLIAVLVVDVALLAYRIGAIVDAYRLPAVAADARRARSFAVLTLLLLTTLAMHGWVGLVTYKTYGLVNTVFHPPVAVAGTPRPTPSGSPVASPTPTPVPLPSWAQNGRLDLLLVGGDAGPGRASLRTDSMTLLSVDLASGRAKLFGIPRNLFNVPLPAEVAGAFTCGCYPDLINSLFRYAESRPDIFPGADGERGYAALQGAIGEFVGQPIDGMLVVDLNGFVRLVDALGGLDITTPAPVSDSHYPLEDGTGYVPLYIPAGPHHFDGHMALAYARSRHQDDDYHRMERQQLTLLALRDQLNPCALVPRLPELLDIATDSLWTNLSVDQLPDLLALAQRVNVRRVARAAFNPPAIPEYLDAAAVQRVRAMVADAFARHRNGGASGTPTPSPSALPVC